MVTGNHYEVCKRFDEHKVVETLFRKRCKRWKLDLDHVLVLWTSPLFHKGNVVSKLVYVTDVRNYGEMYIYQIQTHFLAMYIFQNTNNPFPSMVFKQAILLLVQPFNTHATIYHNLHGHRRNLDSQQTSTAPPPQQLLLTDELIVGDGSARACRQTSAKCIFVTGSLQECLRGCGV